MTDDNHDEIWNEDKQSIFNIYGKKKEMRKENNEMSLGLGYIACTLLNFFGKNLELTD
jgi:hypothetical protein